jgi:hypothetical protein
MRVLIGRDRDRLTRRERDRLAYGDQVSERQNWSNAASSGDAGIC